MTYYEMCLHLYFGGLYIAYMLHLSITYLDPEFILFACNLFAIYTGARNA